MNTRLILGLLIILEICSISIGSTQTYIWPTDASLLLSSSFAEWRYGHFHAGVDIKTFRKIGFPVFAIRSGYIWRIKISPYGYGKVIYQKLDTDEIVVYAHLSRFYEPLEIYAKIKQKSQGQYSINKYFEPNEFPVEKGQVIAYTGDTGIGSPHLHFEIRDRHNRPFNPLQKDYVIIDTQKPVVTAISISPLQTGSQINGKFVPVTLKPISIGNGQYKISKTIQISGTVGLGIKTYDLTNNSFNKLGIYKLKLYLDNKLIYFAEYDKFSYTKTSQIFLDRDYGLMRRGSGVFYKLYKDFGNELDFYGSLPEGSGLISEPILKNYISLNPFQVAPVPNATQAKGSESVPVDIEYSKEDMTIPALHRFKIEISDYYGNLSEVSGTIFIQEKLRFIPIITIDESGIVYLENLGNTDLDQLKKVEAFVSYTNGKNWNRVLYWRRSHKKSQNKSLTKNTIQSLNKRKLAELPRSKYSTMILKAVAQDTNGITSFPYFKVLKVRQILSKKKSWIEQKKDFYNNRIIFYLNVSVPVEDTPLMTIQPEAKEASEIDLIQTDLLSYVGIYELTTEHSGRIDIEIHAQDIASRGIFYEEYFNVYPALLGANTSIISDDSQCRFYIHDNSLYKPLFFRIEEFPYQGNNDTNQIGNIYRVNPFDEPLKKSVQVSIAYPVGYLMPEKLGIYMRRNPDSEWRFVNNKWNPKNRTISANVNELNEYTLIRDIESPIIKSIIPYNGSKLRNKQPLIQVYIQDNLSGFNSDKHLILKLDDEKVIAEYDPEKHRLSFKPQEPLSSGKHQIQIIAYDRSGNVSFGQSEFWIY